MLKALICCMMQRERLMLLCLEENAHLRSAEEMLKEAIAVAKQADVIVAAVGESSEMSGECSSRTNLEIPDAQKNLLAALKKWASLLCLLISQEELL